MFPRNSSSPVSDTWGGLLVRFSLVIFFTPRKNAKESGWVTSLKSQVYLTWSSLGEGEMSDVTMAAQRLKSIVHTKKCQK